MAEGGGAAAGSGKLRRSRRNQAAVAAAVEEVCPQLIAHDDVAHAEAASLQILLPHITSTKATYKQLLQEKELGLNHPYLCEILL